MLAFVVLLPILPLSFVWSAPAGNAPAPGPDDLVLGSTSWEYYVPPSVSCHMDTDGTILVVVCSAEQDHNNRARTAPVLAQVAAGASTDIVLGSTDWGLCQLPRLVCHAARDGDTFLTLCVVESASETAADLAPALAHLAAVALEPATEI
ncbi:uncharacterized protein EHS24_002236 [Apiotrichum porosum]|uniref:Uncharacterized protein n=1 Tax=Apiotrichum porosum TaxID=105984 RepID=A0A427XHZ7_9TREE|nr:uncharacterized protein EHS24_002236 [Apiotrichum porosum]RSH78511.1 hypothetical protein EHS24_002236 [Apiotrichum porosum]